VNPHLSFLSYCQPLGADLKRAMSRGKGETMNNTRSLLCDNLYRIKLLKVGFTGNEIEQLYILGNNLEFVGVNWCNCKKCRSCWDKVTGISFTI